VGECDHWPIACSALELDMDPKCTTPLMRAWVPCSMPPPPCHKPGLSVSGYVRASEYIRYALISQSTLLLRDERAVPSPRLSRPAWGPSRSPDPSRADRTLRRQHAALLSLSAGDAGERSVLEVDRLNGVSFSLPPAGARRGADDPAVFQSLTAEGCRWWGSGLLRVPQ